MALAALRAALFCAWSALVPFGAAAATMQAVYTGTIGSGHDAVGLFGPADTDLEGVPFTLAFSYDTGAGFLDTSTPGTERLWGGSVYGGSASPVTARFTVNDRSQTISGNYQGYVSQCSGAACGAGQVQHLATQSDNDPLTGVSTVNYASTFRGLFGDIVTGSVPASLTQPYGLTFDGRFRGLFDYVFFDLYDPVAGYSNSAYAYLNPTRLSVSQVTPVPVPAGGAVMLGLPIALIVGLRLRAGAARRRRRERRGGVDRA